MLKVLSPLDPFPVFYSVTTYKYKISDPGSILVKVSLCFLGPTVRVFVVVAVVVFFVFLLVIHARIQKVLPEGIQL